MKVLIACEFSGIVREAFKAKGHDAWSCDLLPTEIEGKHYQGDVMDIINEGWDMMIAHPPCTDLSVSGARWFPEKRKNGSQERSIDFFMLFTNLDCPKVCIENPIGIMSRLYKKPDQIIQPWQFGHGETKATCLWLKNLPLLLPTKIVEGRDAKIHKMPPSTTRAKDRSRTYAGISHEMANQWGNDK
jgi:hypothetical protein